MALKTQLSASTIKLGDKLAETRIRVRLANLVRKRLELVISKDLKRRITTSSNLRLMVVTPATVQLIKH